MRSLPRFFVLLVLCFAATTTLAQSPPDPLPMGVPYVYQYGNSNWYRPVAYGPAPLTAIRSHHPDGATGPVYGRYSWDSNVYFAAGALLVTFSIFLPIPTSTQPTATTGSGRDLGGEMRTALLWASWL